MNLNIPASFTDSSFNEPGKDSGFTSLCSSFSDTNGDKKVSFNEERKEFPSPVKILDVQELWWSPDHIKKNIAEQSSTAKTEQYIASIHSIPCRNSSQCADIQSKIERLKKKSSNSTPKSLKNIFNFFKKS